ncbi:MAG: transglycosylase SLT domain-containing protein [Acidobacteria bacterium]|nr:transglycosylase SLT domain-containing protein [Acidobacteriota bacterium]
MHVFRKSRGGGRRERLSPLCLSALAAPLLAACLAPPPAGVSIDPPPPPAGLQRWDPDDRRLPLAPLEALGRGVDHFEAGRWAEALDTLPGPGAPSFLVADYALLYRAKAHFELKQYREARQAFRTLTERHPGSPLEREAVMGQCASLLELGEAGPVPGLLAAYTDPEALYTRARALELEGNRAGAVPLYLTVWSESPATPHAEKAGRALEALSPGALAGKRNYAPRLRRAEKLLAAGRNSEARTLLLALGRVSAPDSGSSQKRTLLLAEADYALERTSSALISLAKISADDPSLHARALYLEGGCRRRQGNEKLFLAARDRALKLHPASADTEELCYSVATWYDTRYEDAESENAYRVLLEAFPRGRHAERARWKLALYAWLGGRFEQAAAAFAGYVSAHPDPPAAAPALYWMGRCYGKLGDAARARYLYGRAAALVPDTFYGDLARARARELPPSGKGTGTGDFHSFQARVDKLGYAPVPIGGPDGAAAGPIDRAEQLAAAGLEPLALEELRHALRGRPENRRLLQYLMARVCARGQDYHGAISNLYSVYPEYAARPLADLPAEARDLLYPTLHRDAVAAEAARRGVEPALVLGLIRQESAFNPKARSRANARGLMQILPSTGRSLARKAGIRGYSAARLYDPAVNIALGTRYLADQLERYGREDLALAAYNAGGSRVKLWLEKFGEPDMDEFIERIPFRETRNYVRRVLDNRSRYRVLLSGAPLAAQEKSE